ncbi:hypothetical protein ABZX88_34425 [Kitasatospora aureofaciens]|uniref:hypothetical protein n=1 Tax=Kitasatospora aureofaciens TaxID=1894 RepID=UPI0033A7FF48
MALLRPAEFRVMPPATPPGRVEVEGLNVPAMLARPVEQPRVLPAARFGRELVSTLGRATQVAAGLPGGTKSDVGVGALATVECTGETQADAFDAGAEVLRRLSGVEVHGMLWARVGDGADSEHTLTVLLSDVDPELGEAAGVTHRGAPGPPCRTVVYLDAVAARRSAAVALTGIERSGSTQADALAAAAAVLRQVPDLRIDGVLWSKVAGPRPDVWDYRLALLASAAGGDDVPAS